MRPVARDDSSIQQAPFVESIKLPQIPPYASLPLRNERFGLLRIKMCAQRHLVVPAFRDQQPAVLGSSMAAS